MRDYLLDWDAYLDGPTFIMDDRLFCPKFDGLLGINSKLLYTLVIVICYGFGKDLVH